ncbi:hypothetical protein V9T40_006591 [Parthenolecanium corni]|uniref:CAP-Gly domain-containing protein n=1 Tax=Parthenolecanium corni TaxID=536013 RepID=A0AAN9Y7S9_9HEMI
MAAHGKVWTGSEDLKSANTNYLDTVRALHQTVVCLRKALERSQCELHLLKTKVVVEPSESKFSNTIEQLALENHVLRRKILAEKRFDFIAEPMETTDKSLTDEHSLSEEQPQAEQLDNIDDPSTNDLTKSNPLCRATTNSEDSEEVDDIELIFTTDDTKIGVQEELEPISDDGEEFESKSEINVPAVVMQSVLVETDISKCGVVYDHENTFANLATVTSEAAQRKEHQPFDPKHLSPGQPNFATTRPVLPHEGAGASSYRDSEAQTDISAVPPHWKSESFLVHNKTSQTFPTLPSKFTVPVKEASKKCSLKLTDKTREARRILLSDINFTSMVPELSRSVDHLYPNGLRLPTSNSAVKLLKSPAMLSTGSSCSRFEFNVGTSNWNCYDNLYVSDHDRSTQDLHAKRRQSWRPSIFSLDTYYTNRTSSVPPSPTLRRHSAAMSTYLQNNGDSQFCYALPDKFNMKTVSNATLRNASSTSVNRKPKSKVSFKESLFSKNTGSRQSLPNMYVDTESGEESTDSLIDESEECVQKTIETTLNSIDWPYIGYRYVGRTYSVPNLFLEFSPPLSARPFIARSPNDLKTNYFVKVINKDGRVVGGRVQFVGSIPGKSEPYIGILLPPSMGETDGSFQGFRYFTW